MELFNTNEASNSIYRNVRDPDTPRMIRARKLCLEMWKIYEPFADKHFVTEIQRDFCARFWEMDLTCTLLELGKKIECFKPGPDIKADQSVWIEAISPTKGSDSSPDRVPEIVTKMATSVNSDLIILRYTASIKAKHEKYISYLDKGIINRKEPYIIALNSSQIPRANLDLPIPRIVSALLPIGSQYVEIDRESGEKVGGGYHYKATIVKSKGVNVPIDMFLNPEYSGISAVLYDGSDCCNRSNKNGSGYILIHNPLASNPIGTGFLGVGKEAVVKIEDEINYTISWINHETA